MIPAWQFVAEVMVEEGLEASPFLFLALSEERQAVIEATAVDRETDAWAAVLDEGWEPHCMRGHEL